MYIKIAFISTKHEGDDSSSLYNAAINGKSLDTLYWNLKIQFASPFSYCTVQI